MTTMEQEVKLQDKNGKPSFSSTLKDAIDLSTSDKSVNEHKSTRYYYSIGSFNFLLENDIRAETLKTASINVVPYLPEWHTGIVSIRGVIMPVIDLHTFVQSQVNKPEDSYEGDGYLLKIEHKEHTPVVFKIDKLPELINISNKKKTKVPKSYPGWIKNYLKQGSTKIAEVDHKELLNQIINTQ